MPDRSSFQYGFLWGSPVLSGYSFFELFGEDRCGDGGKVAGLRKRSCHRDHRILTGGASGVNPSSAAAFACEVSTAGVLKRS